MPTTYCTTTADVVWHVWTGSSTATTITNSAETWGYWCDESTTIVTSTCASTTAWTTWTSNRTFTSTSLEVHPPTTEELAAAEARAQRYRDEAEAERQKRLAAEERAKLLLVENLTLRQRQEFEKHGHFVAHGSDGMRYRIRKGRSGNVDKVDRKGDIVTRLCAHPGALVPDYDTMLAQKLMLEHDAEMFNRVANSHGLPSNARGVLEPLH